MQNLNELSVDTGFRGLFVAKTKEGKTCAAASFPPPVHILDFDDRIKGLLGAPWLAPKIKQGEITFTYIPPRNLLNPVSIFDLIVKELNSLIQLKQIKSPKFPNTLVVDSITAGALGMLNDAIPYTHGMVDPKNASKIIAPTKGKNIGGMAMPGPEDFGYESNGVQQIMSTIRGLGIPNIIVTTHLTPLYQKVNPNDPMSSSIQMGEKLAIRDKLASNIGIFFDHCFRFERRMVGNDERYFVRFRGDIACTSYNLPLGEFDITGLDFYKFLHSKLPGSTVLSSLEKVD